MGKSAGRKILKHMVQLLYTQRTPFQDVLWHWGSTGMGQGRATSCPPPLRGLHQVDFCLKYRAPTIVAAFTWLSVDTSASETMLGVGPADVLTGPCPHPEITVLAGRGRGLTRFKASREQAQFLPSASSSWERPQVQPRSGHEKPIG